VTIPPKLRATAAAAVIFAASACNATTAAAPNPSTGAAAPAAAGKPAAGHLLILSDPGHVTLGTDALDAAQQTGSARIWKELADLDRQVTLRWPDLAAARSPHEALAGF
jgi:hypothetical protein